jgi:putative ABC transport system ATP-binding protein
MPESARFVRTENLAKVYVSGRLRVSALKNINLSLEKGIFAGVIGVSGSGKSTLLNLMAGLDRPSSGSIEVDGLRISEMSRNELASYRSTTVGMIFQSFNLLSSRTALENVELPLIFSAVGKKERRNLAVGMLERVGLLSRRDHRPSELSGGEQQRAAIARALVHRPEILLADEPTGNLDSRTSEEIVSLLGELNREQGLTVIMVTHETDLVRKFAHELIRLQDGEVIHQEELR